MTVPHGLRSSWERDEARRVLVDALVAAPDGLAYVAGLRAIEDAHEFGVVADELSHALATAPVAIRHRRAKQEALAKERQRRRAG